MALDPNINRIKFLRSTTAGNKPTVQMLAEGEIAINLADKTIYSTDGTNIINIGFGLGGSVKGNIDASGYIKAANVVQSDYLHLAPKLGVSSTNGQGDGISLYQGWTAQNNMPAYGLAFAQSATFGGHGAVSGNDWATYFTMNGGASRGWIFKSHGTAPGLGNVASISASGVATFARVDAPLAGNADTATRLKNNITLNGVPFTGEVSVNTVPGWRSIQAPDDRTLKPNTSPKQSLSAFFTTKAGLNGVADSTFGDMLVMNTWSEPSGGEVNGVFFPKNSGGNPLLYRAPIGSSAWGTPREFAMTDSNVATATRLAKSGRWATGVPNSGWWRLASVVIPQSGFDMRITMLGGSGYGTAFNSNGKTEITLRSGNANPKALTMVVSQLDGHQGILGAAFNNVGGDTWEIWAAFGPYSTCYYTVDYGQATDFTDAFAFHNTSQPPGVTDAEMRTLAKVTSNVASATKLQTARNINGVPFDGSRDIRIQTSSLRISSGDLNTLLTEGNYYCDADADAINIANKPMEGSFALEVLRTAGYIQRFTHYNSGRTFIRKSYTGFSQWSEVALSNQSNVFLASQTIDAGAVSFLQMTGTEEAAVVLQKPLRRAVLTIPADNSVGLLVDGAWVFNCPKSGGFNVHAHMSVLDGINFRLVGRENDHIDRVLNPNAAITVNSPEPGMAAIRNALDFGWYNDHFQLGAIRSGSQASHGFGITKGNNDLLWRVTPQGDTLSKGSITAGAHIYSATHVSAEQVYARSGRFGSGDPYHYVDVGQGGRDLTTFAQYGGAFRFINSSNQEWLIDITNDRFSFQRIMEANIAPVTALAEFGAGRRAALNTTVGIKADAWNQAYQGGVHAILQSTSGYRTHAVFGAYKVSNDWSNAGAFIATGGSDAAPTEAYHFGTGGNLSHTSGLIKTGGLQLSDNLTLSGAIRSDATQIQFLTTGGQAKGIAVGGVLASNAYADWNQVPTNGIYSRGDIRTATWAYASLFVGNSRVSDNLSVVNAPGGIGSNGIRAGNMDAALYSGCNLDIQTHNGLGIMDNTGTRKIVFEARAGTIHCQGDLNVRNVNANGTGIFQGNIVTNGTIYAAGNITAFSDRRLKENIKPIDNPIERIKKLNGVTYTRNDLEDKERVHAGLIAQDVQEAMPESVIEVDGILAVDYPSVIALLTETIKDLNARLEKLEK